MKPHLTLALTAAVFAFFSPAVRAEPLKVPPGGFDVMVQGQVVKPGHYVITPDLTVIDAVELAGGFTARALRSTVKITHTAGPNAGQAATLDYSDFALNNANANFKLAAGDVISIPADPTYGK